MVQLSAEHTMPLLPAVTELTSPTAARGGRGLRSGGAMTNVEVTDDRRFWAVS
jgi:hypothetical protein